MGQTLKSSLFLCWVTGWTVTLWAGQVSCYTIEDSTSLLQNLTAGYSVDFRPLYNQSEIMPVSLSFDLVSIQELNEVQEKLVVTGIVYVYWNDSFFQWDPSQYGGVETLALKRDKVWSPELLHVNPAKDVERLTMDWHYVRISSSGLAYYYCGDLFSTSCSINIRYYPLDTQTCEIQLALIGYAPSEIALVPSLNEVQTSFFAENGAWDLVGSDVELLYENSIISFQITLDRKSGFVFLNIIIPIMCMSLLNVLIFLIPMESGERISYSITVLLSIAVLFTLVSDTMPHTSNPMSFFSFYLVSTLTLSILITICTIISMRIHHRKQEMPVSNTWHSLVVLMESKCRKRNRTSDSWVKQTTDGKPQDETKLDSVSDKTRDDVTWQRVSEAVDKLLFVVFSIVFLLDTVIFAIIIASGP